MTFEQPAPDLSKIVAAWEEWERGERSPGRVLADMKTAGFPKILPQLNDDGWVPRS
jgi:hypothetical protein